MYYGFPIKGVSWDMLELSGGSIEMCQPKAQKLVLCVKLLCQGNGVLDTGVNHLFLGFNTIWERNMWCRWLKEVCFNFSHISFHIFLNDCCCVMIL